MRKGFDNSTVSFLVLLMIGGTACSVTKNMDDMKSHLQDVSQDTHSMNPKLSKTNGGLSKIYSDGRQGNSLDSRNHALSEMERQDDVEAKIIEAAAYFQAFEFQLWKDEDSDDQEKLQTLYANAVQEFFLDLHRYLPEDGGRSLSPSSNDGKMRSLYALAATLEQVNSNETSLAKELNFNAASMLSLIESSLIAGREVNAGKTNESSLKEYQQIVLANEDDAIYILKLRSNFEAVAILGDLSNNEILRAAKAKEDYNNASVVEKPIMLVKLIPFYHLFSSWDASFNRITNQKIEKVDLPWIEESIRERDFIAQMTSSNSDNPTEQDADVFTIYKAMKIPADVVSNSSRSNVSGARRQQLLSEFVNAIEKYRKQSSAQ